MRRRRVVGGLALAGLAGRSAGATAAGPADALVARARALETELGGRLGVAVVDVGDGRSAGHRDGERFPMCSSFKWLLAALVLHRVDAGEERLDRVVRFGHEALLEWSPVTRPHAGGPGLTVEALCEAAVAQSDNAAANLLLGRVGGPAAVTRYVRAIGDPVTRLDRIEPALNEGTPGDPRDTTTPAAMAADLRAVLLGPALSPASRERLTGWMRATRTGDHRLRAELPAGWRLADKTGTGPRGTAADVGVYWPPAGAPRVVAVYVTGATADRDRQEAAIAELGRLARDWQG